MTLGFLPFPGGSEAGHGEGNVIGNGGQVLYVLGVFVALVMWGAGLGWLVLAATSIISTQSFPFNMGWWGFTFPLGVFATCTGTLAKELDSLFFRVLTMVRSLQFRVIIHTSSLPFFLFIFVYFPAYLSSLADCLLRYLRFSPSPSSCFGYSLPLGHFSRPGRARSLLPPVWVTYVPRRSRVARTERSKEKEEGP